MGCRRKWTGKRIRDLLAAMQLTHRGLADRMRVSVYTVHSWAIGRREPSGPARLLLEQLEAEAEDGVAA